MNMNTLKRYIVDMSVQTETELNNNWFDGFIIGLHYNGSITDDEYDHIREWIQSNPIIETTDGYGTFEGEVK